MVTGCGHHFFFLVSKILVVVRLLLVAGLPLTIQVTYTSIHPLTGREVYTKFSFVCSVMKYLQNSGYKGNDLIPVFEQNNGGRTYGLSDILNIVVDKMNTDGKVCSKVPINVEHSCTFVVDSSKLGLLNDVRAEDCGSWRNN